MYYKQPKYYGEFKCTGSDCNANCCYGWNIDWKKDEIDKVKNAPGCSSELKELAETGFVPSTGNAENSFKVKLNEKGMCPFQTEDMLCMIQKELGAEYLSKTCTTYPRFNACVVDNKIIYRACNLSCKEIVRLLVNDEKAMELVMVPNKVEKEIDVKHFYSAEDHKAHPELKYQGKIIEFFYELIADKKCSVETNITVGALIAHKLAELIGNKEYDRIPEALQSFRKQVHYAAGIKAIDSLEPNYNVKLGVVDKINEKALGFNLINILKNKDDMYVIDLYLTGEAKLNEMMKDRPFWLRNIALNMLLDLGVPFKSKEHSVFENYRFFVAALACVKLNAIAAALAPEEIDVEVNNQTFNFSGIDKLYGMTGMISRRLFQNKNTFVTVNQILSEFNISSPVHLALLIN